MHCLWQEGDPALLGCAHVGGHVLLVSPLLLPLIFIWLHAEEGPPAPYSVPPLPCSLFVSVHVIKALLLQTSCRITCPADQGACHLPPSNRFFPLSPSSLPGTKLFYFPAPLCLLEQLTPFLFLLPNHTCRETSSASATASGCWRRQHWGFLPLRPGSAWSSP